MLWFSNEKFMSASEIEREFRFSDVYWLDEVTSLQELLDELTAPVFAHASLPRQAYHSISACTAVVASASDDLSKSSRLAKQLAQQLRSPDTTDGVRLFSLLTLGELGRKCPQVYENDPSLKYALIKLLKHKWCLYEGLHGEHKREVG